MSSRPALGLTQPHIQWVLGALSLGVKRRGCEADHTPPTNAEAKQTWNYTSIPPDVCMAWSLIKHRDNFTFTLRCCEYRDYIPYACYECGALTGMGICMENLS
jgi:hypothetical protein